MAGLFREKYGVSLPYLNALPADDQIPGSRVPLADSNEQPYSPRTALNIPVLYLYPPLVGRYGKVTICPGSCLDLEITALSADRQRRRR